MAVDPTPSARTSPKFSRDSRAFRRSSHRIPPCPRIYTFISFYLVYIIVHGADTGRLRPTRRLIDVGNLVLNVYVAYRFVDRINDLFSLRLIRVFDRFADVFDATGAN